MWTWCVFNGARRMSQAVVQSHSREKVFMVVGLGNHGMSGTRHNVGMAAINLLARRLKVADQWKTDKRTGSDFITTKHRGMQLVLLKPRQFMNINGISVAPAAEKFHLTPENIYLLHDELSKPLGKVSLKFGGSAKGHNGVRSCIDYLKSDTMTRLLIGIGRPDGNEKSSVTAYVLGRFTPAEQEMLPHVLEQGVDLLLLHIKNRTEMDSTANAKPLKTT
ncbi:PREDICTED: probable peptidyl-tRNA hydrolase [Nanorana parkeri]|uniref:probable peptidyl-tRNA hydrolase n=1 Tax=Nanorana parkeri TaxID=125878 RepID=UPI000854EA31|nr:PREDICTED: probable peptidyl-tRNA hydrolase [Nanorana parkeri]